MASRLMASSRRARRYGFTLVELIMVIVLVGVLASVAAPRFFQRQGFDAAAYTEQLKALLRYGQKVAIAQNRTVFVRLNGSGVALCFAANCSSLVTAPGSANSGSVVTLAACGGNAAWACEAVPNGLALSAAPLFYFDAMGKPFAGTDVAPTLDSTFTKLVLAVTGDSLPHSVTIEAETGYVH